MNYTNNKFIITSTQLLDNYQVKAYLGVINVNLVIGTNLFSDFAASFTDVFGGTSGTYQRKMDAMYERAQNELIKKSKRLGGNAIVGFRTEFDELSGKGKQMIMLSASGTACIVEAKTNTPNLANTDTIIDQADLNSEIIKYDIIRRIESNKNSFTDDEWTYMLEHPSKDLVSLLITKSFFLFDSETKKKAEALLNQINYSDAVEIVYPLYISPYEIDLVLINPYCTVQDAKKDVSEEYKELIKECRLFDPDKILNLIDIDLNKAISILECEKSYYTHQDLSKMEEICKKLDNLPDVGEIVVGKSGLFSKEEKEFYQCQYGHKNDKEIEYCQECGVNIKGLTSFQTAIIDEFKKRTRILKNMFKI